MQHGQTIRNGAAHHRERTLRRDEALQDDSILLHTLCDNTQAVLGTIALVTMRANQIGVVGLLGSHHLQTFYIHGLNDEGIVVVEGKAGAVGIEAIADVPFFHLAHGHLDAEGIVATTGIHQERLLHTAEQQPVGVGRVIAAQALQLLDIALLGDLIEGFPQSFVAAEQALDDVSGIDKRLTAAGPAKIVGAFGIYRIGIGFQSPLAQLLALQAFGGVIVRQGKPRCDTGHEATEALHIGNLLVAVVPCR